MKETAKRKSTWQTINTEHHITFLEIHGAESYITIEPRPLHCDRGNWLAKLSAVGELARDLDHQDAWPRYYMDLDRAKLEIEDWMKKRGQWIA